MEKNIFAAAMRAAQSKHHVSFSGDGAIVIESNDVEMSNSNEGAMIRRQYETANAFARDLLATVSEDSKKSFIEWFNSTSDSDEYANVMHVTKDATIIWKRQPSTKSDAGEPIIDTSTGRAYYGYTVPNVLTDTNVSFARVLEWYDGAMLFNDEMQKKIRAEQKAKRDAKIAAEKAEKQNLIDTNEALRAQQADMAAKMAELEAKLAELLGAK